MGGPHKTPGNQAKELTASIVGKLCSRFQNDHLMYCPWQSMFDSYQMTISDIFMHSILCQTNLYLAILESQLHNWGSQDVL